MNNHIELVRKKFEEYNCSLKTDVSPIIDFMEGNKLDRNLILDTLMLGYIVKVYPKRPMIVDYKDYPFYYLASSYMTKDVEDMFFAEVSRRDQLANKNLIFEELDHVTKVLETHPYKLDEDYVLTFVSGCVTNMNVKALRNFVAKKLRKADYVDVLHKLVDYKKIPQLYQEAINSLATEYYARVTKTGGVNPVLIIASSSVEKVDSILQELRNIPELSSEDFEVKTEKIVEIQGSYDEIVVAKAKEVYEKYEVPVIVEDTGLEISCLKGNPGPYIKDFMTSMTPMDIYNLCRSSGNYKATLVSAVAISDGEVGTSFIARQAVTVGKPIIKKTVYYGFDSIIQYEGKYLDDLDENEYRRMIPRIRALQASKDYLLDVIHRYKKIRGYLPSSLDVSCDAENYVPEDEECSSHQFDNEDEPIAEEEPPDIEADSCEEGDPG